MNHCNLQVAGESALIIYFDQSDLDGDNLHVRAMAGLINQKKPAWLVDLVPSYRSLLVIFDPLVSDHLSVKQFLLAQAATLPTVSHMSADTVEVPVLYGFPQDNDLARVAEHNQISIERVVELHQGAEYQVYAVGFAPGFAFLGQVSEEISTPRLTTPRLKVPKGAVAIADRQTAVYPNESPGGWNIIGLCPLTLFDPGSEQPLRLNIGDRIRFKSIDEQSFFKLGGSLGD